MTAIRALALALLLWTAPAAAQDWFFDAGGTRIRYVEQGAGAPVVLIHGFTADLERAWVQTEMLPTHPTMHARDLPRNPQFAAAIRRHIARAQ